MLESILKVAGREETHSGQEPQQTDVKPISPFRVLHVDLPFFSDPDCQNEVTDARLIIIQCEDPIETVKDPEPLPTTKRYRKGQIVLWVFNEKRIFEECWYREPDHGEIRRAWTHSGEFIGKVYLQKKS